MGFRVRDPTSVSSDWLAGRCLSRWLSGCLFGSLLYYHWDYSHHESHQVQQLGFDLHYLLCWRVIYTYTRQNEGFVCWLVLPLYMGLACTHAHNYSRGELWAQGMQQWMILATHYINQCKSLWLHKAPICPSLNLIICLALIDWLHLYALGVQGIRTFDKFAVWKPQWCLHSVCVRVCACVWCVCVCVCVMYNGLLP